MLKEVVSKPKRKSPRSSLGPYVRFTLKMLYINSDAMLMIPGTNSIRMSVNAAERFMLISPVSDTEMENTFHLSKVCGTEHARRIETNNSLLSILDAGFPRWALGKPMPVTKSLNGDLIVDLRPQIHMGTPEKTA